MEQNMAAAYYPNNVTTAHIQRYLDENKSLILKIVECQYSGKLGECAESQARLQQNLSYLAAIADSQFPSGGTMQPGAGHHMPHQQAQPMTMHSFMASSASTSYAQQPFSALQQQQLQQQQAFHGHVGMSSGASTGLNIVQSESSPAGGSGALGTAWFSDFMNVSSGEDMHGGGRAIAGGSKVDVGSAVGSLEDRETADDGN